jgi:hypothetical protein
MLSIFPDYCICGKQRQHLCRVKQGVVVVASLDMNDHVGPILVDNFVLQVLCIKFDHSLLCGGASEAVADMYISGVHIPPVGSPQLQDLSLADSYRCIRQICATWCMLAVGLLQGCM